MLSKLVALVWPYGGEVSAYHISDMHLHNTWPQLGKLSVVNTTYPHHVHTHYTHQMVLNCLPNKLP